LAELWAEAEGKDQPSAHPSSPARTDDLGRFRKRSCGRRQTGSVVSYCLMYRTADGRKRTFTIGKHGSPWTPATARQEARRLLREVAKGRDPAGDKLAERRAITVIELCQQYLAEVEAGRLLTRRKAAKTESPLISDRGRIARYIVPLLGRMPVKTVRRDDVERFTHDVAAGVTAGKQKGSVSSGA
jgi:Arm DNA-binding domain